MWNQRTAIVLNSSENICPLLCEILVTIQKELLPASCFLLFAFLYYDKSELMTVSLFVAEFV